jgi:hypothetical protein
MLRCEVLLAVCILGSWGCGGCTDNRRDAVYLICMLRASREVLVLID